MNAFTGPIKVAATLPITEVLRKFRRLIVFMVIYFSLNEFTKKYLK
jgi:hypothetical protein